MLIEMSGFLVTLQRKRVKNINLRIKCNGEVQISAPMRTPVDAIHSFVLQKRAWIEKHRSRLQQLEPKAPQQLIAGECIHFLGAKYVLHLHETLKNQRIALHENQLHCFVKPGASQSHKELLLKKWYCSQMEECLPSLFEKWQSVMGVCVNKINIKRMKSRWGSCQPSKKHITLNLRLMEYPLICLEYVIVHELVHLFEASHNKRFYALMDHYLPNWKQIKKILG